MRRYHRIVASIAEQVPSILPARFGTIMDETELDAILIMRQRSLMHALRHVRGRVQMTIRVPDAADVPAVPSRAQRGAATTTAARGSRRGTIYLEARAAAVAAAVQLDPAVEPIRAALQRWVRDERIERTQAVATVYHLVPRVSVVAYARAARLAIDQAGLRAVLSGPFPPYAFTSW
jgi:hypothetical protein